MPKKPHKWAKEIKAWADGAEVEVQCADSEDDAPWMDVNNLDDVVFLLEWNYRIKPEPKPDRKLKGYLFYDGREELAIGNRDIKDKYGNVLVTFDGETNQLKSVEIIK